MRKRKLKECVEVGCDRKFVPDHNGQIVCGDECRDVRKKRQMVDSNKKKAIREAEARAKQKVKDIKRVRTVMDISKLTPNQVEEHWDDILRSVGLW